MTSKILIIDDDECLGQMLHLTLGGLGYEIHTASDGKEGLRKAYTTQPDLIVLDVMMPSMDGFEVCERLRQLSDVPVLMLTACDQEQDIVHGLVSGADDYVRKPFNVNELALRIQAILKRSQHESLPQDFVYDDGVVRIDLIHSTVTRAGHRVHLTSTEYRLLRCLVRNQGRVLTHDQLLRDVWGQGYLDARDNLSLYIRYLRSKLEDDPRDPQYIRTEWGVGYIFTPESQRISS